MATHSDNRLRITRLIFIPSVITLAVTLARLVGELQHWSPILFNPAPGGGAALIGITWLVFIFGIHFALKLASAGERPGNLGRAIGLAVLGLLVMFVGGSVGFAPQISFPGKSIVGLALFAGAAALQGKAWPALTKTLIAYGYAARVPVAIVMFFAIRGQWGTHYDAAPPGFAQTGFWPNYIQMALAPQLIFWVAFTVVIGMLFGCVATAIFIRRRVGAPAT